MSAVTTNLDEKAAVYAARLQRGVVVEPSGCWRWAPGPQVSRPAGGVFFGGEALSVRRLAYAALHGHLPPRRVYPKCKTATCVNPHHVYMTPGVDEDGPAMLAAWQAGKTHAEIAVDFGCIRERVTLILNAYLAKGGRA